MHTAAATTPGGADAYFCLRNLLPSPTRQPESHSVELHLRRQSRYIMTLMLSQPRDNLGKLSNAEKTCLRWFAAVVAIFVLPFVLVFVSATAASDMR